MSVLAIKGKAHVAHLRKMRLTLAELDMIEARRRYRFYRERYFAEANLPEVDRVFVLFISGNELANLCEVEDKCHGCYVGEGNPFFGGVILSSEDDDATTQLNLLHEMCHMAVEIKHKRNMGHGRHWKAEMKRIAAAGAFDKVW